MLWKVEGDILKTDTRAPKTFPYFCASLDMSSGHISRCLSLLTKTNARKMSMSFQTMSANVLIPAFASLRLDAASGRACLSGSNHKSTRHFATPSPLRHLPFRTKTRRRSICSWTGLPRRRLGAPILPRTARRGMKVRTSVKKFCEGCKVGVKTN